ncbi:MAG: alginate export family protein [Candidatus Hydrogenedentes bacterium]|nr:alginate export family protein [Candidatus Hydrogenedentota bacterium]
MFRTTLYSLCTVLLISTNLYAELQSVEVGGKLEIYGLYYHRFVDPYGTDRIPPYALRGRSIGPTGTVSIYRTGKDSTGVALVEQRTRLHTKADFSENLTVFIEVDSIDTWGEDFRSANYLTGIDSRADSSDDLELFQSYIQMRDAFSISGLSLTLGRQAVDLGSGWLVGSDPGPNPFVGLSFDGIRIQYEKNKIIADLFWGKVAESLASFNEEDTDFYSTYLTFKEIIPELSIDIYYLLLRDDLPREFTEGDIIQEAVEDLLDIDTHHTTYIHTWGTRLYGGFNNIDYEVEIALQYARSASLGKLFVPVGYIYGEEMTTWTLPAGNFEIGYTLSEHRFTPRFYLGGCYYGAKDRRSISFADWLFRLRPPKASPAFNRLFTAYRHDSFIDLSGMSNFWKINTGVTINPTEKVEIGFDLAYLQAVAPFDRPFSIRLDGIEIYPFSPFSFITEENDKDLGWQTLLSLTYNYNDNLSFSLGWSHFFIGKGLAQGIFLDNYATAFVSTTSQSDSDFFYIYSTLEF